MRTNPGAPPVRTGSMPLSPKARIILPIALSVGALAVFMLVFWPSNAGHKPNKSQAHRGAADHGSNRGAGYQEAEGNTPVTRDGYGSESATPAAKGDTWWFKEKEAKAGEGGKDDQWWYQGKSGSKSRGSRSSQSPVGGS